MFKRLIALILTLQIVSSANAFMLGSDVTEMVTAPFTLHKTGDNEIPMPKSVQKAMDLFSDDEQDVDLAEYVKAIRLEVTKNFKPQQFEGSPNVVILFKITKTGRIDSYKILKPSKDLLFDHAAVRAVQAAAPFEFLPSGYEKDILKLQFTFTKHGINVNYF